MQVQINRRIEEGHRKGGKKALLNRSIEKDLDIVQELFVQTTRKVSSFRNLYLVLV